MLSLGAAPSVYIGFLTVYIPVSHITPNDNYIVVSIWVVKAHTGSKIFHVGIN